MRSYITEYKSHFSPSKSFKVTDVVSSMTLQHARRRRERVNAASKLSPNPLSQPMQCNVRSEVVSKNAFHSANNPSVCRDDLAGCNGQEPKNLLHISLRIVFPCQPDFGEVVNDEWMLILLVSVSSSRQNLVRRLYKSSLLSKISRFSLPANVATFSLCRMDLCKGLALGVERFLIVLTTWSSQSMRCTSGNTLSAHLRSCWTLRTSSLTGTDFRMSHLWRFDETELSVCNVIKFGLSTAF